MHTAARDAAVLNPAFARFGHADVRRLIDRYPLAWVIAPGAPASAAALLPMLGDYDADGALVRLVGHMSRGNALCDLLRAAPQTQFLFTGPQGYVSPEDSGRLNWGPTWNYAALRIEGETRLDAALTRNAVERLLSHSEAGRAAPWAPTALGPRYERMLDQIIGFEVRITALDGTFKLAQDEDEDVLASLVSAHPDAALREWMRALNRDRLG